MIKTAPSPLRLAGLIGFVLTCVVTLTYLWISFGGSVPFGPAGYRIQVAFPQANELAGGADVRIAGVNVGTVVGLTLDKADSRTLATLEISRQFAPVPRDTRATLRIKTLVGETYVALSDGNRASGALPDGGRLPDGQVDPDVTLDQILSTFDPKTRLAFQTWMQAQAGAVAGRGEDINASFGLLPGFIDSAEHLVTNLNTQAAGVRSLVANTGEFFNAISARRGQLSGFISAANSLFQTTAARNRELADLFRALPQFELQSRLALPALTAFGERADPVVRALEPIATELETTFAETAQLAPQFRGLFDRLGPTVAASKRGLPAFDRILGKLPALLSAFGPFLRNVDPVLRYIGEFKPEVAGFFANVTAASQARDTQSIYAPGQAVNYVRAEQTLTPSSLSFYPHPLGIERGNAYRAPNAYDQLQSGLQTLDTALCAGGVPAAPTSATGSIPITPGSGSTYDPTVAQLIQQQVYRSTGTNVAAPSCRAAGHVPGFNSSFPHLTADPPPSLSGR